MLTPCPGKRFVVEILGGAPLYQNQHCECREAYTALVERVERDIKSLKLAVEARERAGWEHEAACARTALATLLALLPAARKEPPHIAKMTMSLDDARGATPEECEEMVREAMATLGTPDPERLRALFADDAD